MAGVSPFLPKFARTGHFRPVTRYVLIGTDPRAGKHPQGGEAQAPPPAFWAILFTIIRILATSLQPLATLSNII